MAYTPVTIITPEINKADFKELASDLIDTLVNGDTSPFKDAQGVMTDFLDNADTMSDNQKANAYADFLLSAYKDINTQAMNTAMDLLKSNEQLKLETYKTKASYDSTMASIEKIVADTDVAVVNKRIADKNLEVLEQDRLLKKLQTVESRAKLKKQYGVVENSTQQIGDGTNSYKAFTDGIWYQIRTSDNAFVKADGTITTTPNVDGIPAIITGKVTTSETLENTVKPGALDKQIRGYDMVNFKDIIKTMDQKAALMQNAKVQEDPNEKILRTKLIGAVTNTQLGNHDGTGFDANGNLISVPATVGDTCFSTNC